MGKPAYVGVFLDRSSRKLLLDRIPGRHSTVHANHVTLAFGKAMKDSGYPIGKRVTFRVWGVSWDLKGQAVVCVSEDLEEFLAEGQNPHITISCAEGVQPKYSNTLLKGHIEHLDHYIVLGGTLDFSPRTVPDETTCWQTISLWFGNLVERFSSPGYK